jgi:hypothetical protein
LIAICEKAGELRDTQIARLRGDVSRNLDCFDFIAGGIEWTLICESDISEIHDLIEKPYSEKMIRASKM